MYRRRSRLRVRIQHREVQLIFLGVKINKEVVNLVENFLRTRIRPVNLIDHQNRLQVRLKRLAQHITSLRQRPFARIDQQHDPVDHLERPLHFTAKIGVPRRIHNIDFCAGIEHGCVLGKNSDPALAFQVVRVHDALGHGLVVPESAALPKHGVHQRSLAVIDVGNDSDVANTRIQIENSSIAAICGLLLLYYENQGAPSLCLRPLQTQGGDSDFLSLSTPPNKICRPD